MTKGQPEQDQVPAQAEATPRRARAARRSGTKKYNLQFLPEGEDSEPEFKIDLPAHADPERFIEKQEDFEPGRYRIALLDGGKFTREVWVYRKVDPLETVVAIDETGADEPEEELLATVDDEERIAKIAAREVVAAYEAKERTRAPQPAPVDPFSFIERSLEIEEKMRARSLRDNPPASQPIDPSETFLNMLDKYSQIAERLAPIRESDSAGSSGVLNGLTSLVRELGTHGSSLLPLLPALVQQVQGSTANGNAHAAANGQQQVSPAPADPVQQTLSIIVNDLKRNRRVGRAADAIEDLYLKRPDSEARIEPLLALPAADLLAQLSQFAGEDLTTYSHAVGWLEDLQAELSPDEDLEADEASEADDLPEPVVSQDELR